MIRKLTSCLEIRTGAKLLFIAAASVLYILNTHVITRNTIDLNPSHNNFTIKTIGTTLDQNDNLSEARVNNSFVNGFDLLSRADQAAYTAIFNALENKDWTKADALTKTLGNSLLLGTVLAEKYKATTASGAELANWLKLYGTQPEAQAIFAQAKQKFATTQTPALGMPNFPKPTTPALWSSGYVADSAADFSVTYNSDWPRLLKQSTTAEGSELRKLANAINHALKSGNNQKARDLLINAQDENTLAGTFAADAEAAIAASYFYKGEREQASKLANSAAIANQPLGLWINGLITYENGDYETAGRNFSKLSKHPALNLANRAAANFWAWRSFEKTGDTDLAETALADSASVPGSFYGLLAAQILGHTPITEAARIDRLPVWGPAARNELLKYPAGKRALALLQIGQISKAEEELRHLSPLGNENLQQAMLALAGFVPMPGLAIQIATLVSNKNYTAALYPLLPWQPQNGFQVDRALLFALARHESRFDPEAISAKGARGLMQLMPATANGLSDDEPETDALTNENLFDPAVNIELGQKYVQHLSERPKIGDNLVLLLAAYNGGPNKVAKWLRKQRTNDALLFIESIPARETRNYVMRVLPHYWAYRVRLAEPLTSLQQIATGAWPKLALNETAKTASRPALRLATRD